MEEVGSGRVWEGNSGKLTWLVDIVAGGSGSGRRELRENGLLLG